MMLRISTATDCATLARLHAECFAGGWSTDSLQRSIAGGAHALIANEMQQPRPSGFILLRTAADEAEILSLGVTPARRRLGLARQLVRAGAEWALGKGAKSLFLEVSARNIPACGLYRQIGFARAGHRPAYYRSLGAPAEDALILKAALPLADCGWKNPPDSGILDA